MLLLHPVALTGSYFNRSHHATPHSHFREKKIENQQWQPQVPNTAAVQQSANNTVDAPQQRGKLPHRSDPALRKSSTKPTEYTSVNVGVPTRPQETEKIKNKEE
uniref:Uncharacterized protein n=1 Tax=Physcomitrium patens TaxID=3218 RepID=A0A2K1KUU9_PHYPA|nr:hypothetical protein PHYPA_004510 [Physcomitrium patens]